ncbi:MAG: DUF924 family protein [Gammaproteobacteria bacterium]
MNPDPAARSLLDYWFSEPARAHWFRASEDFDRELAQRFGALHRRATNGDLGAWSDTPAGALTLVILLDQCSRNFNRGHRDAYANDAHARRVARAAIARGFDQALDNWKRAFLYMPFMHSESLQDQDESVRLFTAAGLDNARYALHHREIIRRFGRFPHRNQALGRESTGEESAYLASEEAFHG